MSSGRAKTSISWGSLLSEEAVEDGDGGAALQAVVDVPEGGVGAVAVEDEGVPDDREALREVGRGLKVDQLRGGERRGDREEDGGGKEEND